MEELVKACTGKVCAEGSIRLNINIPDPEVYSNLEQYGDQYSNESGQILISISTLVTGWSIWGQLKT